MVIKTLDLFSGIGGFSVALKSICRTVGYCDVEPTCRAVIRKNIALGALDDAHIFEDVKSLTRNETMVLKPDMITAGFPCTDISIANVHGKGIDGDRSGLFFEILRIVDETPSVQALFLENSHAIIKRGLSKITDPLKERGFLIKYCVINACDVGALHKRKRWYCLCYKKRFADKLQKVPMQAHMFPWRAKKEHCTRMIKKPRDPKKKWAMIQRCKMLGNSVVPQCAAYAWNTLVGDMSKDPVKEVKVQPSTVMQCPPLDLVITDGQKTFKKTRWATPCYSIWHIYSHITSARAKTVLTVQLFYEQGTHLVGCAPEEKTSQYKLWLCNPCFIEYLMGYPKDWTKFNSDPSVHAM